MFAPQTNLNLFLDEENSEILLQGTLDFQGGGNMNNVDISGLAIPLSVPVFKDPTSDQSLLMFGLMCQSFAIVSAQVEVFLTSFFFNLRKYSKLSA